MTEINLLVINQCMIFRIVGQNGEVKRNAGEWQQSDFLASGTLHIYRKEKEYFIRIVDQNGSEICQVHSLGENVETVNDSSRYYILHVSEQNGGRNAIVGLGFGDRQSAFDFSASLQTIGRREEKEMKSEEKESTVDYVLRKDETITLPYDLPSETETFGELPPFDEKNVPSLVFDRNQIQQMDINIEELKRQFDEELYQNHIEYRKEHENTIDFDKKNQSESDDDEIQPQQKETTFDLFSSIPTSSSQSTDQRNQFSLPSTQSMSTSSQQDTFDLFSTPQKQSQPLSSPFDLFK